MKMEPDMEFTEERSRTCLAFPIVFSPLEDTALQICVAVTINQIEVNEITHFSCSSNVDDTRGAEATS
jgi:hypothetical protein